MLGAQEAIPSLLQMSSGDRKSHRRRWGKERGDRQALDQMGMLFFFSGVSNGRPAAGCQPHTKGCSVSPGACFS